MAAPLNKDVWQSNFKIWKNINNNTKYVGEFLKIIIHKSITIRIFTINVNPWLLSYNIVYKCLF